MPNVKPGEDEQTYIARCIPYCIENEGLDQKQAAGKCYGMYRQAQKNESQVVDKIDFLLLEDSYAKEYPAIVVGKDEGGYWRVDVTDSEAPQHFKVMWLTPKQIGGIQKPGIKGKVVYRSSTSMGAWYFIAD